MIIVCFQDRVILSFCVYWSWSCCGVTISCSLIMIIVCFQDRLILSFCVYWSWSCCDVTIPYSLIMIIVCFQDRVILSLIMVMLWWALRCSLNMIIVFSGQGDIVILCSFIMVMLWCHHSSLTDHEHCLFFRTGRTAMDGGLYSVLVLLCIKHQRHTPRTA